MVSLFLIGSANVPGTTMNNEKMSKVKYNKDEILMASPRYNMTLYLVTGTQATSLLFDTV